MSDSFAVQRRTQSENVLKDQNLQFDSTSPAWNQLFSSDVYVLRDKEAIVHRCLAVLLVALQAEGLEADIVAMLRKNYPVESSLTQSERHFLDGHVIDAQEKAQFVWYYEAAWALLWVLGYVDSMGQVNRYADAAHAVLCMRERSYETFMADAIIRDHESILNELDLLYRYDLVNLHYQQNGLVSQAFDEGVVFERFYALFWACDPEKRAWDVLTQVL